VLIALAASNAQSHKRMESYGFAPLHWPATSPLSHCVLHLGKGQGFQAGCF